MDYQFDMDHDAVMQSIEAHYGEVLQLTLFEPAKPTDMYQVQQDIREKAGITKSPECHDEVSLDEWRRRVGKTFDSYRIY